MIGDKTKGAIVPKNRFVKFVAKSGRKGTAAEATLDGRLFSREGERFRLTIHDDGSVDLSPVGDVAYSDDQLARFVGLLEDRSVAMAGMEWVLGGVEFEAEFSGKTAPAVLCVEVRGGYSRLKEILGEDTPSVKVTRRQSRKISTLMDFLGPDPVAEQDDHHPKEDHPAGGVEASASTAAAFGNMLEEKAMELRERLARVEDSLDRRRREAKSLDSMIRSEESEAESLRKRIRKIGSRPSPNGYLAQVSERLNELSSLDDETEATIRKAVSKVKAINLEPFMKMFTSGEFAITLYDSDDPRTPLGPESSLPDGVLKDLARIGVARKPDGTYVYFGELTWHEIVERLLDAGFGQVSSPPNQSDPA